MTNSAHAGIAALIGLSLVLATAPAWALVGTDRPGALLLFPYTLIDAARGHDTLVEIANSEDDAVTVACFYEDTTAECEGEGTCLPAVANCSGRCLPRSRLTVLRFDLDGHRPVAWLLGRGLASPAIPAVTDAAVGVLRCLATDAAGEQAVDALVGRATLETYSAAGGLQTAAYGGLAVRTIGNGALDDEELQLGGAEAEFAACPQTSILHHFYDGAAIAASDFTDAAEITTTLVLAPCGRDLINLLDQRDTVTFVTYNEFGQRFSSSKRVDTQHISVLSAIDAGNNPTASIFHVAVQGSLTGQTYIASAPGEHGVVAMAIESHRRAGAPERLVSAGYTAHLDGERQEADVLILPLGITPSAASPTATISPTLATPVATPTTADPTATATQASATPTATSPNATATTVPAATATAIPSATTTTVPGTPGENRGGGCSVDPAATSSIAPALSLLLCLFVARQRRRILTGLFGAAGLLLLGGASSAQADLTVERGASILSLPRVVVADGFDTSVQISNAADETVRVVCIYINVESGETLDFELTLKEKQPAAWLVSAGKSDDTELGLVPPLVAFQGELLCIELDAEAVAPVSGNHLRGEATVLDRALGVVKYAAVGVRGFQTNNNDRTLCLGGDVSPQCPNGAEYEACPERWIINHPVDGSPDPLLGEGSQTQTTFTVVPCSHNLLLQEPASVAVEVVVTTELDERLSGTIDVEGGRRFRLADVSPALAALAAGEVETVLRPAGGLGGFIVTAEILRQLDGASPARAAAGVNVPRDGRATVGDLIIIP